MRRRILSLLLAFAMVLGMMPVTAMAEETSAITITAGDQTVSVEYGTNPIGYYKAQIPSGMGVSIATGEAGDLNGYLGKFHATSDNGTFELTANDIESELLPESERIALSTDFSFLNEGNWVWLINKADTEVFIFLQVLESETPSETFTVTLTEGENYTIAATPKSVSPVAYGGSYSFTVDPADGYNMDNAVVKANDTELTPDAEDVYTIQNITADQVVTVEGVEQTIVNKKTITAPAGAEVHVYHQNGYDKTTGNGNDKEIEPVKAVSNGDTVTYTYSVPSAGGIYVAFYDGKIPYAGYFNDVTDVELSWENESRTPSYRGGYDTSTEFGSYADDSVYTNVNSNGHLVLNNEFMLRAYRGWQIVNTTTNNVMIEPEFNYSTSNENITITPYNDREGNDRTVKASGTSSNNWVYLTPNGSGITYLEIGYDAVHIVDGFAAGGTAGAAGQPSNFTWNASDDKRTALIVVQTDGNAASGIDFGIQSPSGGWDYEYDTVYFTESQGSITMKPTGDVATVSVSHDKGGYYQPITGTDGTYTVPIIPGNNIIKITDSSGKTAFQVVRGAQCSYTVTNLTREGAPISVGDEVRVDFHDMHMVCPKISGVYNPGYSMGGGTNKTSYKLNGTTMLNSSGYQYDYHNNVWVKFTAPNANCLLTGGVMQSQPAMGSPIGALYQADPVNSSATTSINRNILPDITIAVEGVESKPATGITLDPQSVTLGLDGIQVLNVTVEPVDTTDEIVWKSSDEKVATVEKGIVTAVGVGKATITVTAGAASASCEVEVEDKQTGGFKLETSLIDPENVFGATVGLSRIQVSGATPVSEIANEKNTWTMDIAAGTGDSVTVTMTAALGAHMQGNAGKFFFWANGTKSENSLSNYDQYTYTTTLTPEWTDNTATLTLGVGITKIQGNTYTITMTRVAAEEEPETYTVTLPENPVGYTIEATEGSASPVEQGGSYGFTVTVDEETYQGTPVVKANDTVLTADENGVYTISNITADQTVTVEGITAKPVTCTVTFTEDTRYTIIPVEYKDFTVPEGGDFRFTVEAAEGYDVSNITFVTSTGVPITCEEGVYTISGIHKNVIIAVDGVVEMAKTHAVILPEGDSRYTIEIVEGKFEIGEKGELLVEDDGMIVFTVTPAAGYENATFAVSVNGESLEPEDGAYVLAKIDKELEVTVTVTEAQPQTYTVTLNQGTGYTLNKLVGSMGTVTSGGSYGFTVKVKPSYVKGSDYAVKVNGTAIQPQTDGTYLIENITENKTISVVGVEPCMTNSVDVYLSVSQHNDFITKNGKTMALQKLTVPYFDLALYGLDEVYYNPDCYAAGGDKYTQVGGTPETANGNITSLHLFIYATEVLYNNRPAAQAGKGWLANEGEWNGYSVIEAWPGSVYGNFWDFGEYNTYFLNYNYPLGRATWGAACDQILLSDGDIVSIRYKNTTDWGNQGTYYHFGEDGLLSTTAKQGEQVTLTLYKADENYTDGAVTTHTVVTEDCNVYVTANSAPVSHAAQTPVGTTVNGQITLDTASLTPGTYYVTTNTHDPAVMMLIVEENNAPDIMLSNNKLTLTEGETATLTANVSVSWDSDDDAVATVSENGLVTAVKAGTATITASANGKITTCVVTVNAPEVDITYGELDNDGELTANDAVVLYQFVNGIKEPTAEQRLAADVNHDGDLDAFDAVLVYQVVNGVVDSLPTVE